VKHPRQNIQSGFNLYLLLILIISEFNGYALDNPRALENIDAVRTLNNNGALIHTNMPYKGINHADNLRAIQ
jgi:hypothetical protein